MVAQSRITEYNKDVKNIFTKGFRVINRNWTYKPLYKTHINHFTNSGLLGEDFKVKKESDGLIIQGNQINIRLSQTIVYTNIKKTFEGLFIMVKLENSGALNLDEIKSSLNNASHQTPINLNQQDDYLYLCISSENMMNIGLKEKEPLNFENIISKILTIKSIAEALCQISDKNAVSNTMELSY